ncbi:hypothetical protein A3759_11395 [Thalassolituus sp. HI0120]|nr:hypothetical protein A3759_11395 [Thalassolituus sp. HI0120]
MLNVTEKVLNYIGFSDVINYVEPRYPKLAGFYETVSVDNSYKESIDLFFELFLEKFECCTLHTTATEFSGRTWTNADLMKRDDLVDLGWIRTGLSEKEIISDFLQFDRLKFSSLRAMFELVMAGMLDGYVFLYHEGLHVAIYPHKYGGFGFIADKKAAGYSVVVDFLESECIKLNGGVVVGVESNQWAGIYDS